MTGGNTSGLYLQGLWKLTLILIWGFEFITPNRNKVLSNRHYSSLSWNRAAGEMGLWLTSDSHWSISSSAASLLRAGECDEKVNCKVEKSEIRAGEPVHCIAWPYTQPNKRVCNIIICGLAIKEGLRNKLFINLQLSGIVVGVWVKQLIEWSACSCPPGSGALWVRYERWVARLGAEDETLGPDSVGGWHSTSERLSVEWRHAV